MRRGAANAINRAYDPATDPDEADTGRATATVELVLDYEPVPGAPAVNPAAPPTVTRSVELLGPGDIRTLKPETVLRVYPEADSPNATAGELAYVEFYEEDLPWRYTPAHPATPAKLKPWLALLVLADDEFTVQTRTAEPSVLTVHSVQSLPPPGELWAWAHTQLAGEASAADAGQRVADDPNAAISRLLSPRRLKPGVLYTAFLVPSFETGLQAGLGLAWADTPALNPSWDPTKPLEPFPVYHSWSFTTGTSGTFEACVRKLVARPVGDAFGKRTVRVEAPGFGLDPQDLPSTFELEGALAPPSPGFTRAAYPDPMPGATAVGGLQNMLDQAGGLLDVDLVVPLDPGLVSSDVRALARRPATTVRCGRRQHEFRGVGARGQSRPAPAGRRRARRRHRPGPAGRLPAAGLAAGRRATPRQPAPARGGAGRRGGPVHVRQAPLRRRHRSRPVDDRRRPPGHRRDPSDRGAPSRRSGRYCGRARCPPRSRTRRSHG